MTNNAQIWQIARMLGKDEFLSCLSLTTLDDLHNLDAAQLRKVQQCTLDNVNRITRALVHEAAARDDITTTERAATYLDERLSLLGDMLSEQARQRIREGYQVLTQGWGAPTAR